MFDRDQSEPTTGDRLGGDRLGGDRLDDRSLDNASRPSWRKLIIRWVDQAAVAVIVMVFGLAIVIHLIIEQHGRGGLIQIDDAPQHNAEFTVDVNRADWPELATLPGIGEHYSREIVKHREKYGLFSSPEELLEVHGIGEIRLSRIKPYLVFNGELPPDGADTPAHELAGAEHSN